MDRKNWKQKTQSITFAIIIDKWNQIIKIFRQTDSYNQARKTDRQVYLLSEFLFEWAELLKLVFGLFVITV